MRNNLLALVLFSLLLTCCGPSAVASTQHPLQITWSDSQSDYIFILAQELGLYKKYNVAIDLIPTQYYASNVTKFASNQSDGFIAQMNDVITISDKHPLRVVLAIASSDGADAVVATKQIKSPADLRHKRIGVDLGRSGELLIEQMLSAYGLIRDDVILIDMAPEHVTQALGAQIDAGYTRITSTQELNNGQVIFSSANIPYLFTEVLVLQENVIQSQPEQVRGLVAALVEAADYWSQNPAAGSALIAKFLGRPDNEVALKGIKLYSELNNQQAFTDTNNVVSLYRNLDITAAFMTKTGLLSTLPSLDELLDSSFLP